MQGTVIVRLLGVLACAALVAGCNAHERTAAGETPVPSQTTMAQANSTAAPDQALSSGPGDKYFAHESSDTHGVSFSVWLNGHPVNVFLPPGKAVDITKEMRGHANVVAVQWTRTTKDGTGALTIESRNKPVVTAKVTATSPATGKVTKSFVAPQAPVGRPSPGG